MAYLRFPSDYYFIYHSICSLMLCFTRSAESLRLHREGELSAGHHLRFASNPRRCRRGTNALESVIATWKQLKSLSLNKVAFFDKFN